MNNDDDDKKKVVRIDQWIKDHEVVPDAEESLSQVAERYCPDTDDMIAFLKVLAYLSKASETQEIQLTTDEDSVLIEISTVTVNQDDEHTIVSQMKTGAVSQIDWSTFLYDLPFDEMVEEEQEDIADDFLNTFTSVSRNQFYFDE